MAKRTKSMAASPLRDIDDPRPELLILASDPAQTASDLVAVLAPTNALFRRDDHLVRVIARRNGGAPSIMRASIPNIVDFAHQLTRPVRRVKGDDGSFQLQRTSLPDRVAAIVLGRIND